MPRRVVPLSLPSSPRVRSRAEFGAFVRACRTRQGLRIDDAAALCGVSVQLLNALETGSRSVGLDKALHVAEQLGLAVLAVPAEDLPAVLHGMKRSER